MLSVLIVNWNTCAQLCECLSSIYANTPSEPFEVIVVDNASTDGSADAVRKGFPQAVLIEPGANTGYAKGNNLAFQHAKGDLLLTLNPDTVILPGAFDSAAQTLRRLPNAGCLGIKLIGMDGKVQDSVRGFPSILNIFGATVKLDRVFPNSSLAGYRLPRFDYGKSQPAPQPMGTFLLFKREALESVGDANRPFDESFPIYFNEVDLLYRLSKAGYPSYYLAETEIRHHHGAGTKQVRKAMVWESHKSLVRFLNKHYRTLWNAPAYALVAALVYGAAFVRARGYSPGFRA